MTGKTIQGMIRKTAPDPMRRHLSIGLLALVIALTPLLSRAADSIAEDLGDEMSISLKDLVKTTTADQCALQVANAGYGIFEWLADSNRKDQTIGDDIPYNRAFETQFSADVTLSFKTHGSFDHSKPESNHSTDLNPSKSKNHDYHEQHLRACVAAITQPQSLLTLPLPHLRK